MQSADIGEKQGKSDHPKKKLGKMDDIRGELGILKRCQGHGCQLEAIGKRIGSNPSPRDSYCEQLHHANMISDNECLTF